MATVLKTVVEEHKSEKEAVQIQDQNTVELIAMVMLHQPYLATLIIVQLMVDGATGVPMVIALQLVEQGRKQGPENVLTHRLHMVVSNVMDLLLKLSLAMINHVQLMAVGANGQPMANALVPAEMEYKGEKELVLILAQNMVVHSAMAQALRPKTASTEIVL